MFPTVVCSTNCCYLAALTGLKELAGVSKNLADNCDRCTCVQKCLHRPRLCIFQANRAASLDYVPRSHYDDVYARAWIGRIERIPMELDGGHAMTERIVALSARPDSPEIP